MRELLIVVGIVMIIQFINSYVYIKYYQHVVRKMSQQSEGYLGVGMDQSKFRVGKVCVIVTDVDGTITECKMLSGITVFSRFRKDKTLLGLNIHNMDWTGIERKQKVTEIAIMMIKNEMARKSTATLQIS